MEFLIEQHSYFTTFSRCIPTSRSRSITWFPTKTNVSIAYTITGTHKSHFWGIPPTGKKVKARGVLIARFENGKIVERLGSSDELGILKQIGVGNGTVVEASEKSVQSIPSALIAGFEMQIVVRRPRKTILVLIRCRP